MARNLNINIFCWPFCKRPRSDPCLFFFFDSDEEVCEVVMDPCAPSRRETLLELIWCGLNCENFGWVLTKTRVSLVFLASLLCLSPMSASSDVEMCSEVCESECVESQHVCGSVHCKQFVQLIT